VPSSWTKARETREQKTGNGSTCTASLWKRQHLHCASLASQFCTGKPNGLHQRKAEIVARQYVHAITQVNAAEEEQDILENQPCERTHMALVAELVGRGVTLLSEKKKMKKMKRGKPEIGV